MDFALNDEQKMLQDSLRDFLAAKSSEGAVREQMEDPAGYDESLWRQMAGELGLQSLAIPEEYGGSGFTFVELGIALEELGRALTVSPFFASAVMASELLLALGDEGAKQRVPAGARVG